MRLVEMDDLVLLIHSGGNEALASENVILAKTLIQHFQVMNAIQQGENRCVCSERGSKRRDCVLQVISLATEKDEVKVFTEVLGKNRWWAWDVHIAIAATNVQA